jgi:uncharacterized protein (TIGR00288 family)
MGMRSDLSKELNNLLNSDIIKGKVTVQRAYADWRRYPQYIVPLSENSVDLIFAPAYGSSKKNATDIRMAIDAIELVFIRPEIGTFILLTGDSDFSSLVLKLKEYGKYVIGVGIQESSSDILVQNCDEYYSYTSIAGLRKTTDSANKPVDPWLLVEQAVDRMASRDDVMRSDRLKQVMMEIDPTFDEGNFGFSKFSRFLTEAGSRDVVALRKLENGQYEVMPAGSVSGDGGGSGKGESRKQTGKKKAPARQQDDRSASASGRSDDDSRGKKSRSGPGPSREAGKESGPVGRAKASDAPETDQAASPSGSARERRPEDGDDEDPLKKAYRVLREAIQVLSKGGEGDGTVRDSDLKRKMLHLEPSFDEGELGFGKFSRFLRQAHDHEVVDLTKRDDGTYQVAMRRTGSKAADDTHRPSPENEAQDDEQASGQGRPEVEEKASAAEKKGAAAAGETERSDGEPEGQGTQRPRGALRLRRGGRHVRRGAQEGPPPLLEGQVVAPDEGGDVASAGAASGSNRRSPSGKRSRDGARTPGIREKEGPSVGEEEYAESRGSQATETAEPVDVKALGLPTDQESLVRYLCNSYKGVGKKTAEKVVDEFGTDLFKVLHEDPARLDSVIRADRAERLLKGWEADLTRRSQQQSDSREGKGNGAGEEERPEVQRRSRRGSRTRGRSRKGSAEPGGS